NGGRDVPLAGTDCRLVARYERWLREQGVCPNTSSCYLRSLRAIYNKAAQRRQVKDRKPFRNAFTGNDRTVKRSIGAADIRKLHVAELPAGSRLALARDLFIFSFCAMGMPFADMAQLRRGQIKEGMLTYCRRKTGRQVRVKIEGPMRDILDRYAREDTDCLFPILYRVVGKRLRPRRYSTALRGYNRALQTLAQKAGIRAHLSSYVPRHSWASMAYRHNVALPVISQALGHGDTHTTLIYIRGIDDRQVAKANKKLLSEILAPPLGKRWNKLCNRLQI
ncbi:MAG: site-specific integrase, partial [Prevotella sp.]|nr:site-specific integrase [Prevotella sp.]